jgi:hypothetical protein
MVPVQRFLLTFTRLFVPLRYRMVYLQTNEAMEEPPIKMRLLISSDYSKDFQFGSSFASAQYVSLTAPATCTVQRFLLIYIFSLVSLARRTTMRL